MSAKHAQAPANKDFNFSPFGTAKSKGGELKARLTRERELKNNAIKNMTQQ